MFSVQNHFQSLPDELIVMILRRTDNLYISRLIDKRMRNVSEECFKQIIAEMMRKNPVVRAYNEAANATIIDQPMVIRYTRIHNMLICTFLNRHKVHGNTKSVSATMNIEV